MSWEIKSIGTLFETVTGATPSKSQKDNYGNDIPFVKPPELNNTVISTTQDNLSKKGASLSRVLPSESILISCIGNLGKVGINTIPVAFNQQINAIKPSAKHLPKFMFYQAISNNFKAQLHALSSGTTISIVNKSKFNSIKVVLPSIDEQKRIVAILDEAFEQIDQAKANAEQNLKNAREVFESAMDQMFTKNKSWVSRSIADCFKLRSGDGLTKKQMDQNGIYPVFGGNGIAGKHNAFNLTGSNIIIGRVGALCGNVRFLKEDIWLTDNAFKVIDLNYDFDLEFLTYLLNHKKLLKYARQAAQPVISNSSLKDVVIAFPKSLQEQKNIVENLDNLQKNTEKLQKIYQQKIKALNELKQSLLQKAFSGELTHSANGDAA